MALVFPRDMTNLCRWRDPSFKPMYRQELARDAGGATQAKDLGPALWEVMFTSVPLRNDLADQVIAEFHSLRGAVHSLLLHHPRRSRPIAAGDLDGVSVAVHSVQPDGPAIRLSGLPPAFEMSGGDYVSVTTAAGGYEFLQLVRGGVASAGGVTPALEVTPYVRPAVQAGDAVAIVNAVAEYKLVPGTLEDSAVDTTHRQISFTAIQVIR